MTGHHDNFRLSVLTSNAFLISRGYLSPHNSRKTPIARPLGCISWVWNFTFEIVVLCAISCYTVPRYIGNLYQIACIWLKMSNSFLVQTMIFCLIKQQSINSTKWPSICFLSNALIGQTYMTCDMRVEPLPGNVDFQTCLAALLILSHCVEKKTLALKRLSNISCTKAITGQQDMFYHRTTRSTFGKTSKWKNVYGKHERKL